jgi:hypothetical protein
MGTIGTRGVLAGVFIATSGLLTGMASLPASGQSGELAPAAAGLGEGGERSPGLFDRVVHRACTISVAATRSDLRTAADRERECR